MESPLQFSYRSIWLVRKLSNCEYPFKIFLSLPLAHSSWLVSQPSACLWETNVPFHWGLPALVFITAPHGLLLIGQGWKMSPPSPFPYLRLLPQAQTLGCKGSILQAPSSVSLFEFLAISSSQVLERCIWSWLFWVQHCVALGWLDGF